MKRITQLFADGAIDIFFCQALAFPILTVALACTSFIFGGCCSAWQWWLAVTIVIAAPFAIAARKPSICADIMFAALLAAIYVVISFYTDEHLGSDYPEYHLPAIRFLIEGWNPVKDPEMTGILNSLGMEAWDMRYLHVTFCEKAVWIFNAVAYKFLRQPYAISYALNPFLELALLISAVRFAKSFNWHWFYGALITLFTIYYAGYGWPTDDAVVYASAILLMAMTRSIRDNTLPWIELIAASFWLMNTKMSSLLSCFVFWCIFTISWLWKHRKAWKRQTLAISSIGIALVALLILVSWSPLITSYVKYGHPLYPMATSDQEKYPVMDIAWHFRYRNADGERLGYFGNFANAYISPSLVKTYYNRKLNRDDFSPRCWEWDHECGNGANSALPFKQRVAVQFAIIILALIPGMRILAIQFLLGLFCIPQQYFGYLRYSAWINFLIVLAFIAIAQKIAHGHKKLEITVFAVALLAIGKNVAQSVLGDITYFGETEALCASNTTLIYSASAEDTGYTWTQDYCKQIPEYRPYIPPVGSKPGHRAMNNTRLLMLELGLSKDINIAPYSRSDFPCKYLLEYHGNYFRRSPQPITNLSELPLPNRVFYVFRTKLKPFIKHGLSMLTR